MTAPGFNIVPQDVARNPVARAIEKRRVSAAIRDFLARLYMLHEGEQVAEDIHAAAKVLVVALAICEHRGYDSPVIRGAVSACEACAKRGFRWKQIDAPALDAGLERANAVYQGASAQETQDAFLKVSALELAAELGGVAESA